MDDPWKSIDGISFPNDPTINSELNKVFDDNFCPVAAKETNGVSSNSKPFQPLPDSSSYLESLEKRLSKIQKKSSSSTTAEKRDLIFSLSGTRDGHIDRFLNSDTQVQIEDNFDSPVEESLSGTVIRHIAPHLQAVTAGELVHLLKADQLQETSVVETEDPEPNNSKE